MYKVRDRGVPNHDYGCLFRNEDEFKLHPGCDVDVKRINLAEPAVKRTNDTRIQTSVTKRASGKET